MGRFGVRADAVLEQLFINFEGRTAAFVAAMVAAKMDSVTKWAQLRNKLAEMVSREESLAAASTQDLLTFTELARRTESGEMSFLMDAAKFMQELSDRVPDIAESMRGGMYNRQDDPETSIVERLSPEEREGMRDILMALSSAVRSAQEEGGDDGED